MSREISQSILNRDEMQSVILHMHNVLDINKNFTTKVYGWFDELAGIILHLYPRAQQEEIDACKKAFDSLKAKIPFESILSFQKEISPFKNFSNENSKEKMELILSNFQEMKEIASSMKSLVDPAVISEANAKFDQIKNNFDNLTFIQALYFAENLFKEGSKSCLIYSKSNTENLSPEAEEYQVKNYNTTIEDSNKLIDHFFSRKDILGLSLNGISNSEEAIFELGKYISEVKMYLSIEEQYSWYSTEYGGIGNVSDSDVDAISFSLELEDLNNSIDIIRKFRNLVGFNTGIISISQNLANDLRVEIRASDSRAFESRSEIENSLKLMMNSAEVLLYHLTKNNYSRDLECIIGLQNWKILQEHIALRLRGSFEFFNPDYMSSLEEGVDPETYTPVLGSDETQGEGDNLD